MTTPVSKRIRLESLDALRGFDMFWIIGGGAIIQCLATASNLGFLKILSLQMDHVPWEGLHFYDLIWPLFMFIMGVALPLSIASRRASGVSDRSIFWHAVRRSLIMFFLGTITQGNLLEFNLASFHPCYSVLHGLAAGYLVAAIITLKIKARWHPVTIGILLLAYWAMVMLIPVPGTGAGVLTPQGNVATYFDQLVLGRFHFGENTWFMSYPAFGASVLLGVLAGQQLMSAESPGRKMFRLAAAGIFCIGTGLLWSIWFPVIKLMWTSTYVLVCGGMSFLLMVLFYWIIDVKGYKHWAFWLKVIGMNSIAIYLGIHIIPFYGIADRLASGLEQFTGAYYPVIESMTALAIMYIILYWMYKKGTFIKI